MHRLHSLAAAGSGLFLLLASACNSDPSGSSANRVSLSFANLSKSGAMITPGGGVGRFTVSDGTNSLRIDKAQIVMRKIELASASTAVCTDDDMSDDSECEELRANPALVDLPTTSNIVSDILVSSVPTGSYTDFEGKVGVVKSTDPGGMDFLNNNTGFAGVSVHVEGMWNGVAFTYDGTARAELELAFSPPLDVGTTGMNITVNVDLGSWFMNGSTLVDPSSANSGGANEALVAHNIRESFEAFEDENHDGHDDHKP